MCMRKVQVEMWKQDSDYWEVVDLGTSGRSDDRDLDRFGGGTYFFSEATSSKSHKLAYYMLEIGGYSH